MCRYLSVAFFLRGDWISATRLIACAPSLLAASIRASPKSVLVFHKNCIISHSCPFLRLSSSPSSHISSSTKASSKRSKSTQTK